MEKQSSRRGSRTIRVLSITLGLVATNMILALVPSGPEVLAQTCHFPFEGTLNWAESQVRTTKSTGKVCTSTRAATMPATMSLDPPVLSGATNDAAFHIVCSDGFAYTDLRSISRTVELVINGTSLVGEFNEGWAVVLYEATADASPIEDATLITGTLAGSGVTEEGGFIQITTYSGSFTLARTTSPVLENLDPAYGGVGDTVDLIGSRFGNFGQDWEDCNGEVRFGDVPATILSWTDTRITVVVPPLPPDLHRVTVTTTAGVSDTGTGPPGPDHKGVFFDTRSTQDFLREAVANARKLLLPTNPNPTVVQIARQAGSEAKFLREWCEKGKGNYPYPQGDVCIHNPHARDAEYFLFGYQGGITTFGEIENILDFIKLLGTRATEIYNLCKEIAAKFGTVCPIFQDPDHPTEPGGFEANLAGYASGVLGEPLDVAIETYGQPLQFPAPSPSSVTAPILPNKSINGIPLDSEQSTADINTFSVAVNTNQPYFFDPMAADTYILAVAGSMIASVMVPLELGLADRDYTIVVGDQQIFAQVGEIVDFPSRGFSDGVEGFAIFDLDVPRTIELVTRLTFVYNGNIILNEVSLHYGDGGVSTPINVSIAIKPGSDLAPINPKSNGVVPVAVLTTSEFDVGTIDPSTVRFGRNGTEAASTSPSLKDVNGDGKYDLVFHFKTQETGVVCGDTSAKLTGNTKSGQSLVGSGPIKTTGCK